MSKGLAAIIAIALAVLPGNVAGQEIGVSMRINRAAAPQFESEQASADLAVRIPAGWAVATSRGVGGGASSPAAPVVVRGRTRVLPAAIAPGVGVPGDTVTVLFVPL